LFSLIFLFLNFDAKDAFKCIQIRHFTRSPKSRVLPPESDFATFYHSFIELASWRVWTSIPKVDYGIYGTGLVDNLHQQTSLVQRVAFVYNYKNCPDTRYSPSIGLSVRSFRGKSGQSTFIALWTHRISFFFNACSPSSSFFELRRERRAQRHSDSPYNATAKGAFIHHRGTGVPSCTDVHGVVGGF
jgi:hypothetical protein